MKFKIVQVPSNKNYADSEYQKVQENKKLGAIVNSNNENTQKFSRVSKNFYSWMTEVRKYCQKHQMLILLFKNYLKISNFEKSA